MKRSIALLLARHDRKWATVFIFNINILLIIFGYLYIIINLCPDFMIGKNVGPETPPVDNYCFIGIVQHFGHIRQLLCFSHVVMMMHAGGLDSDGGQEVEMEKKVHGGNC